MVAKGTAVRTGTTHPTACVLGDLDMVAPLALAGIRCSIVTPPGDPAAFTRRARAIGWADPRADPEALLNLLVAHGRTQPEEPVLFYQSDAFTHFVGRYREELSSAYRILIPDQVLLEDLLDKLRFRALAERLELPVPESRVFDPRWEPIPQDLWAGPMLVKPSSRDARWAAIEPAGKAIRVDTPDALTALLPRLTAYGRPVLLQQVIPGPESRIESYHCYIDARGEVAAAFTGIKIRTRPVEFGHTTAAMITDTDDVKRLGREILSRLGLRGVAKLDFKRDADGRLWLLEVNPRYTLWLHPAARAGVNIPAMVWADLAGRPRPRSTPVRTGVTWCSSWDLQASRQWRVPLREWLPWVLRCEARSMMSLADPLPLLRLAWIRGRRGLPRGR
jgi:D-aspartate ligase